MASEFDWVDRERGILTERDRQFLLGQLDDELSESSRNVKRHRIRKRVENALYDMHLLSSYLPFKDYKQIFEPAYKWAKTQRQLQRKGRTTKSPEFTEFHVALRALPEFYARGLYAGRIPETDHLLAGLIEQGVQRGYRSVNQRSQRRTTITATLNLQYGEEISREEYLQQIWNELPEEPDERAGEIIRLNQSQIISERVAQSWLDTISGPGDD